MCRLQLFGRLTDLAPQRRLKLSAFYGEEDVATLHNVLHRVPNIVPQPQNCAGDDDDDDVKTGATRLSPVTDEPAQSGSGATATVADVAGVHVSLHPDRDGAYVNPAVSDSVNPDRVDVVGRRTASKDSTTSRRLVRQEHTASEAEDGRSVGNPDDSGLNHDTGSALSASASDEDALNKSTLCTFLRMVSTQSTECSERSESRDASGVGNCLAMVIIFYLLSFFLLSQINFPRSHRYLGYLLLVCWDLSSWHAHMLSFV